jgi:Zn-dependent protease with chaperone function
MIIVGMYKLVDDKAVNAWCMPGGKIVVYRNFTSY